MEDFSKALDSRRRLWSLTARSPLDLYALESAGRRTSRLYGHIMSVMCRPPCPLQHYSQSVITVHSPPSTLSLQDQYISARPSIANAGDSEHYTVRRFWSGLLTYAMYEPYTRLGSHPLALDMDGLACLISVG